MRCDLGGGGPPRWPVRRGSACAAGTRGSSRDDGCSAGKCACPWSRLSFSRSVPRPQPSRLRSDCQLRWRVVCGTSFAGGWSVVPAALAVGSRVIPWSTGVAPEHGTPALSSRWARARKNTRRRAGDSPSVCGQHQRRQNRAQPAHRRTPSPRRNPVTTVPPAMRPRHARLRRHAGARGSLLPAGSCGSAAGLLACPLRGTETRGRWEIGPAGRQVEAIRGVRRPVRRNFYTQLWITLWTPSGSVPLPDFHRRPEGSQWGVRATD